MSSVEELEARIEDLEQKLADKAQQLESFAEGANKMPGLELEKYDLNDNEKRVLSLLSVGLNQSRASEAAGLNKNYVSGRMRESVEFATAYSDLRKKINEWAEARVSFTLPLAWQVLDRILMADPESYLSEHSSYAKALLQAQEKVAKQMVRLDAQRDAKLTVEHQISEPLMQVQQKSLDLVAQRMAQLRDQEEQGQLEHMTPEYKVLDVEAETVRETIQGQPIDYKAEKLQCLECDGWYTNLSSHLYLQHDEMGVTEYKEKHSIGASCRLDYKTFIKQQAYLEDGSD